MPSSGHSKALCCVVLQLVPASRTRQALSGSGGPAAISCPTLSGSTKDHMLFLAGATSKTERRIWQCPALSEAPQKSEELPAINRQEIRPRAICPHLLSATAVADAQQAPTSLQNELLLTSQKKKLVLRGKCDKKPGTFSFQKEVGM